MTRLITSIDDAKALEGEEVGLSDWIVIDRAATASSPRGASSTRS
jgi:hypothetical protein